MREFYANEKHPVNLLTSENVPKEWEQVIGIKLIKPETAEYSMLIDMAEEKATEYLEEYLLKRKETTELLEQAKTLLGLSKLPLRIEGYDISNIQGKEAVGSMVVFEMGKPVKSQYRRFRIKWVEGPDDYSMHEEVIRRRLAHTEWKKPDLILIDGGIGQLNRVNEVIREAGWQVDVLAISKDKDRDHIWTEKGEILVPDNHPVYFLLQRVRDESHRFAVSYHRKLRSKRMLETELEKIEGIGPVRRRKILEYLGDTNGRMLESYELARACNIPLELAQRVAELLRNKNAR